MKVDWIKIYNKVSFYMAKISAISYIYIIHFILAYSTALALEKASGDFDIEKADKQNTITIFFHSLTQIIIVGIFVYIIRNIAMYIPNPLEGAFGLEKNRIKELVSAPLISFTLLFFYDNLKQRMLYLSKRLK